MDSSNRAFDPLFVSDVDMQLDLAQEKGEVDLLCSFTLKHLQPNRRQNSWGFWTLEREQLVWSFGGGSQKNGVLQVRF